MIEPEADIGIPVLPTAKGIGCGVLIAPLALLIAFVSAGAGHGDYVAVRALFPFSMLMTLVEGSIGPISFGIALLQFPLYGAAVGWAMSRRSYRTILLLLAAHLAAAAACFTGILPYFS